MLTAWRTKACVNFEVTVANFTNNIYTFLANELANADTGTSGRNNADVCTPERQHHDWQSINQSYGEVAGRATIKNELAVQFKRRLERLGSSLVKLVM